MPLLAKRRAGRVRMSWTPLTDLSDVQPSKAELPSVFKPVFRLRWRSEEQPAKARSQISVIFGDLNSTSSNEVQPSKVLFET